MKLQSKIIFSFFILIFLSFVGSYIATTQIWQRNLEERNNVYRERISKSISETLAMYYKSWGSFDRGWENVLVTSMTNLGLDPEKNSVGVIDSNFEPTLLDQDRKRPWSVKQRIKGRHGHLSNEATYSFLDSILGQSSIKTVYLAHLSKDCNCVKLVSKNSELLKKNHSGLEIVVVDPHQEFVLTT